MKRLLKLIKHSPENQGDDTKVAPPQRFSYVKAVGVVLVLIVLGVGSYEALGFYKQATLPVSVKAARELALANNDVQKGNRTQALIDAKKALSYTPHDSGAIMMVAYLEMAQNPSQAKQYFSLALKEFQKQANPDISGKSAETYWAAAGLAEQAGEVKQAIKYYQEVITVAKPTDTYEQSLAAQSQVALKRLTP